MTGDWSDSWKPPPPSYAERIRRGEHEGRRRRKVAGERFSPSELAAMREQALALSYLGESGWLPEQDGRQAPLLPERALEGG